MNQQIGGMQGQQGMLGSLIGNSAMGSHQGVDQSQLGNNSGFSKILGEP